MADDNTVTINENECPYKGDGLQGWGELMKGFAQSHGRLETEREECSAEQVKDISVEAFKEAPKEVGVMCMDGDGQIGDSYADVH